MVLKAVVPLRQKQHRWNVNQSHIMQSSHEHIQKGFVFKISCKSTSYLTWYTSREALKTLEGITPRHFFNEAHLSFPLFSYHIYETFRRDKSF